MAKNIELEIRGEIRSKDFPALKLKLRQQNFRHHSTTKRTSVMSFGRVRGHGVAGRTSDKEGVDVRCRITNGHAEVVAKIGLFSASNRVEVGVPVSLHDMLAFSRIFGAMPFFTKVGSKTTWNYQKGPIMISLVKSPSGLAYIEIEKMTDRAHEKRDAEELRELAKRLGVRLWKSHQQFLDFCGLLTKRDDWVFRGTDKDMRRLRAEIKQAGSATR